MSTTYDAMWEKLNLDLDAHAGLLQVLGKFYGDIYLSQTGRLRGMEYLDFVLSEVHGLRIKELQDAKAAGQEDRRHVLRVCARGDRAGGRRHPGGAVRRSGSRQGCRREGPSPKHLRPDQIVCRFQALAALPLHRILRSGGGGDHLRRQEEGLRDLRRVRPGLRHGNPPDEERAATGSSGRRKSFGSRRRSRRSPETPLPPTALKDAIRVVNERRRVLQRLNRLRAASPVPISGRDVLLVNQISFYDDPVRFTENIGETLR